MHLALWIVQTVLALLFLAAGAMKLAKSKDDLRADMAWVEGVSPAQVKAVGAVEVAAALGLILPAATGILPVLTPLAAAGLVIVMVLAAATHLRLDEASKVPPNVVLGALALFVAIMRFGPEAF
ncbi:putative integral membrane protein [Euzebya pacifica]|uniref:Putative integral membrane protein n=1 Tax=Euzebya pacifica TaxID=1608957 RepID=A0A346Y4G8_9ACTN|nr:DoxX family protein [Euzebya pacifica]AXV09365.1 putative integral membrane protein [Euzebya pacifica]